MNPTGPAPAPATTGKGTGDHRPPTPSRLFALVPCGGSGSRAGAGLPKQYRSVAGQPVLAHTLRALGAVSALQAVVVVVAPDDSLVEQPHAGLPPQGWAALVPGPVDAPTQGPAGWQLARCAGSSRAATVYNGLLWLQAQGASDADWVLVHDAARCLVTPDQVQALITACMDDAVGGLLALPLADTLKAEVGGRVATTLGRADKWLAQTPQMFRLGALREALALAEVGGFADITDEASALEAVGLHPLLVPGSAANFKLTYPSDFALAHALLTSRHESPLP